MPPYNNHNIAPIVYRIVSYRTRIMYSKLHYLILVRYSMYCLKTLHKDLRKNCSESIKGEDFD